MRRGEIATTEAPTRLSPPLGGRLPMLLGAIAGLALCAAALAIGSLLTPRSPDPAPTARALCTDLVARDYAAAYELLSPRQQAAGTSAQFAASQRELDALRGATSHCDVTLAGEEANTAQVTLTITRGSSPPVAVSVRLLLVGGTWRVDAFDSSVVRGEGGARQAD